jgi:hypothetical protein
LRGEEASHKTTDLPNQIEKFIHSFEVRPLPQGGFKKISLPIAKFYSLSVDSRPHILFSKNAKKELIMGISMTVRTSGFRKWSEAHDPKIAVRAVAVEAAVISAPDLDQGLMTPAEQPHRPWLGRGPVRSDATPSG